MKKLEIGNIDAKKIVDIVGVYSVSRDI